MLLPFAPKTPFGRRFEIVRNLQRGSYPADGIPADEEVVMLGAGGVMQGAEQVIGAKRPFRVSAGLFHYPGNVGLERSV